MKSFQHALERQEKRLNGFGIDLGPYKGREFVKWEKNPSVKCDFSNSPTTSIKQFRYGELRARHGSEKGFFPWKMSEFPLACSCPEVEKGVLGPGEQTPFQACVGAGAQQPWALRCCLP